MLLELALVATLAQTPECAEGLIHYMPFCLTEQEYINLTKPALVVSHPQVVEYSVEYWRPWIEIYFKPWDVERAMRILGCETGWTGDPWSTNESSGAAGLFQHMPRYWAERSARFGWDGYSIYNPDANIAIASHLVYHDRMSWSHWVCK